MINRKEAGQDLIYLYFYYLGVHTKIIKANESNG